MADISAAEVKKLREKTGAGMMECKNALVETGGDFAAAEKLLKEKGLAALEKRADRATNCGNVIIKIKDNGPSGGSQAVLVELTSETDFVAKNPDFLKLGEDIASIALEKGLDKPTDELTGMVQDLATKIRENMGLKRLKLVNAGPNEFLCKYIHGENDIGVLVKVESDKPEIFKNEEVKNFIFTLALHVAWAKPLALDRSKLDQNKIKEQEEILRAQMSKDEKLAGKPQEQLDKILAGKVEKYLKEICLLDQGYVKEEKISVAKAIEDCAKKAGASLSITDYVIFIVGVE